MNPPKSKSYYRIRTAVRALFWTLCAAQVLAVYAMFLNLLFQ